MSYPGKMTIFVHPQKETPGIAAALGRAYPVCTGIGAIGTVLIGILVFKEPASFWRLFFIFTLIASVIGLRMV